MEFGLKGTSRVCRGRDGEVGIVECGHKAAAVVSAGVDLVTSASSPELISTAGGGRRGWAKCRRPALQAITGTRRGHVAPAGDGKHAKSPCRPRLTGGISLSARAFG